MADHEISDNCIWSTSYIPYYDVFSCASRL